MPLFDEAHRDRVRKGELPRAALHRGDSNWKSELRALLEQVYLDDEGTICEELCNADADPEGALRCYREIVAKSQREGGIRRSE